MSQTAKECANCKAETDLVVCWPCGKQIRRQLAGEGDDTPPLWWYIDRLNESAYGEAKLARMRAKVSGQGETPGLPLNTRAAKLLHDMTEKLHDWSIGVLGASAVAAYAGPSVAAQSLAGDMGKLMNYALAAQMLRDLQRMRTDAERIIDLPPDLQYVGTCPTVHEQGQRAGEICGVGLYVERGETVAKCPRCKMPSVVEDLQRVALDRVDDEPKTAADMWRLLKWLGRDVPRSSFYRLVGRVPARMFLQPDGRRNMRDEPESTPLYAYSDVVAMLDANDAERDAQREAGRRKRGRPRKVAA